jgi:hypothetical protein
MALLQILKVFRAIIFFEISYEPKATIEFLNKLVKTIPSLYNYQLDKRIKK